MISLPDRVKKDPQPLQDSLRLHYFPDIPVDDSPDSVCSQSGDSGFQRIFFKREDIETDCSDDAPISDSEETSKKENAPSIDEVRTNAFQEGFAEGEKAGFEAGTKRVEPLIASFNQGLEQLKNIRQEMHQAIEKEVVQLALSIAKKIVCHEVKTNAETVVCVAREALGRVENPGKIKIKLNPTDLQFIQDTKSQLSHLLQNVDGIRFEAEDSIQSGGCVIETEMGDIDARIEKQFQAIEESFQIEFDQPARES
jgi:flagellar biosynthesis/type III secretory pathway protein FliH